MTDDSIKLAQVWLELRNIKNTLDNEVLPVGGYLGIDDPELMTVMRELSEKIGSHFGKFKLVAEIKGIKTVPSEEANKIFI